MEGTVLMGLPPQHSPETRFSRCSAGPSRWGHRLAEEQRPVSWVCRWQIGRMWKEAAGLPCTQLLCVCCGTAG